MEWVETTGKTVHDAKETALDALGVDTDDAEFEIINDARTGLFGRVKEEARVRARVRPTTPRAKDDRRRRRRGGKGRGGQGEGGQRTSNGKNRGGQKAENGGESRGSSRGAKPKQGNDHEKNTNKGKQKNVSDEPTMPLEEQADIAEAFVADLAENFGTTVTFDREQVADDEIRVTVNGENIGRMIGQRGTTAGAIDELVRTVLQRHAGSGRGGRIRVDMGGVRARRAEALAAFVREQAAAVRESGVSRALEPMGGADRKVVHDTISDEAGVDTASEGEDPNRRVIIVPAGMLTDDQLASLDEAWTPARAAGVIGTASIETLVEHTVWFAQAVCSSFSATFDDFHGCVVDVGTGAGLPGVILAALSPMRNSALSTPLSAASTTPVVRYGRSALLIGWRSCMDEATSWRMTSPGAAHTM